MTFRECIYKTCRTADISTTNKPLFVGGRWNHAVFTHIFPGIFELFQRLAILTTKISTAVLLARLTHNVVITIRIINKIAGGIGTDSAVITNSGYSNSLTTTIGWQTIIGSIIDQIFNRIFQHYNLMLDICRISTLRSRE